MSLGPRVMFIMSAFSIYTDWQLKLPLITS